MFDVIFLRGAGGARCIGIIILIWIKKQLKYSYLHLIVQGALEGISASCGAGEGGKKYCGALTTVTMLRHNSLNIVFYLFI
jgi:hypothetical protein